MRNPVLKPGVITFSFDARNAQHYVAKELLWMDRKIKYIYHDERV